MNNNILHIGKLVLQKLNDEKRPVAWLAHEITIDESHLRKVLKNQRNIHTDLLFRISIALKHDFFYYYSQLLQETGEIDPNFR